MIPKLIIHGGAGPLEGELFTSEEYHANLVKIIKKVYSVLKESHAREAVLKGIRLLEDNPIFNAGTGSRLQEDGQVRMTAAVMNSDRKSTRRTPVTRSSRMPSSA